MRFGWNLKISLVIALAWAITLFLPPVQTRPILDTVTKTPTAQASAVTFANTSIQVPILMYHHVGPLTNNDAITLDLTVSSSEFEAQVVYFKNKGYQSVTLAQLYGYLVNNEPLPKKPIVFTFDDGYKDVFSNAVPILQKYGFVGTFAIPTELLGRPGYAVWDDITTAQKSGMEIVSHSENHLDLSSKIYSDEDLHREIFGSKQILEQKLGTKVNFFVYPYGKYNDKVIKTISDAGYKIALTTEYGQGLSTRSLLTTPRVRVHGGAEGLNKLRTIFDPAPARHTAGAKTNP